MKKDLLIISIYAPSDFNVNWYELQRKFIRKNTLLEYDYKIILNGVDCRIFRDEDILIVNQVNQGHPAAIQQALDFMKENKDAYKSFLLLDSDSFPVGLGWHFILDSQMQRFNKIVVAPIRYENLDQFPHPSIVYFKNNLFDKINLDFSYGFVKNLLNIDISEVGGKIYNLKDHFLPIVRTNKINLHPVAAAIYHHLFYHHGAGSRIFQFRVTYEYDYYYHFLNRELELSTAESLNSLLFNDAEKFIDFLIYGV